MPVAKKLKAFLDEAKVRYHVLAHHEEFTAQKIAEALHIPGQELAKVVMVKGDDGRLRMAVLPAPLKVDLSRFAKAAGMKSAKLATEAEFRGAFPECDLGAMPPFGNLYDLPVYVDRSLGDDEEIVFEAGNHREAVKLAYRDFERLVKPTVGEFGSR